MTIKEQVQSESRALLSMESGIHVERERISSRRGTVLHVRVEFFVPDETSRASWRDIPLHDVVTTACDDLYMRLIAVLKTEMPRALGKGD